MQLPIKVTRYGFTSRIPLIQMLGLCLGPEYLTVDLAGQNKDIQLALNGVSDFLWWALHNIICSVWPFPLFSSWTNLLFWFWKLYLSMIFFPLAFVIIILFFDTTSSYFAYYKEAQKKLSKSC